LRRRSVSLEAKLDSIPAKKKKRKGNHIKKKKGRFSPHKRGGEISIEKEKRLSDLLANVEKLSVVQLNEGFFFAGKRALTRRGDLL